MRHHIPTMGSPPGHWRVERNRALFRVIDDRSQDGQEELLTVSHITGVTPRSEKNVTMFMVESLKDYKRCQPGELVINTMWAWMGPLGVTGVEGIVSPSYHVCRTTEAAFEPRYFNYFYRTPAYVTEITRNYRGVWTSRLRLYPEEFLDMESFVPPADEQRAIADFLDRKTAAIDALIEKKERLVALLAEQRAALIHRAVTRGLDPDVEMKDSGVEWIGEVPAHWEVKRLKYLLHGIEQVWSPECHGRPAEQGEWGVLKAGCVNYGTFREDENKVLPENVAPRKEYQLHIGDVLMSRASGSPRCIGSVATVRALSGRLLLCDKLYRLKIDHRCSMPDFVVLVLGAPFVRAQSQHSSTGQSTLQNIGQEFVKNIHIPTPPIAEQVAIAEYLNDTITKLDQVKQDVATQMEHLREYRQTLITAAVTGQLDISTDERAP